MRVFSCGRPTLRIRPRSSHFLLVLLLAALLIAVSACSDSGVAGLDLIDEEGGDALRVTAIPTDLAAEPVAKVTGAVRGAAAFSGLVSSVLSGKVEDPLIGGRTAIGHIDFRRNLVPTTFASDTVVGVELRFVRGYAYGDTSGAHTFVLSEMGAAWDPTAKVSSTDLGSGTAVTTFSVRASDSLVAVELPGDWVSERRSVMNSTGFDSLFHGFQITPLDARSVFGFSATSAVLRIGAKADTVDMISERIFTRLEENSVVEAPNGTLRLADGMGEAIRANIDFQLDEAAGGVLSRVTFTVPVLSDLPAVGPSTFVRPPLQQLDLYGVKSDGTSDLISTTVSDSSGTFRFIGVSAAVNTTLLRVAQQSLTGTPPYDHFRLLPPTTVNTMNVAFMRTDGDGSGMRVVLTLISN